MFKVVRYDVRQKSSLIWLYSMVLIGREEGEEAREREGEGERQRESGEINFQSFGGEYFVKEMGNVNGALINDGGSSLLAWL